MIISKKHMTSEYEEGIKKDKGGGHNDRPIVLVQYKLYLWEISEESVHSFSHDGKTYNNSVLK